MIPPKTSDFTVPDADINPTPEDYVDFNGDGKQDAFINFGACGTGGCMYGVFIFEYENLYSLAYYDYLNDVEFEEEDNGFMSIISYEDFDPYNPFQYKVTIYKLDEKSYQYEIGSTFIYNEE